MTTICFTDVCSHFGPRSWHRSTRCIRRSSSFLAMLDTSLAPKSHEADRKNKKAFTEISFAYSSRESVADVGVVTPKEIRGWYFYDWAFSPYYQVADIVFKWILKRLAENAEKSGEYKMGGLSTGSYPSNVLLVTCVMQVICLLSLSAFGDYGRLRKMLLVFTTYMCCTFLCLCYFCTSSSAWWFAGLLRIASGCSFVLTNVYYNAYLPTLTSQNPDVLALQGEAAEKKQVALSDEISAKGFGAGYCGGMSMQIVTYLMLLAFECKSDCSDYDRLRWITLATAICGVWWGFFSLYTFRNLKVRTGNTFPADTNVACLGWRNVWSTLREMGHLRNTAIYVLAYFVWSDALATTLNVCVLVMDEPGSHATEGKESLDSGKFVLLIGATLSALLGVFIFMKLTRTFNLTSKGVLMIQLCSYGLICTFCARGALLGSSLAYYGCMVPITMMLGSLQANQRSLFSSLVPVGKEASMFALYTITDKGSSIVGYSVISVVHTTTHSYVGSFWYCTGAFFLSAWLLYLVDVQQGMRDCGKGRQKPSSPTT